MDVVDDARAMGANTLLRRVSAQELRRAPVHLTDRQLVVLEWLATGATYGEIAADIGYSHSTVRKDVLAIYRLLQVHDRDGALAEARRRGTLLGERQPRLRDHRGPGSEPAALTVCAGSLCSTSVSSLWPWSSSGAGWSWPDRHRMNRRRAHDNPRSGSRTTSASFHGATR